MSTSTAVHAGLHDPTTELFDSARRHQMVMQVFEECGMPADDAEILTDHLIWADLHGLSGRGTSRVPEYVGRLRNGGIRAKPHEAFRCDSFMVIDAEENFAEIIGYRAMKRLIRIARSIGVSAAVVRDCTDTGTLGCIASLAAEEQMIGFAMNSRLTLHAAPAVCHRSLAVASPAGRHPPLLLDQDGTRSVVDPIAALDELMVPTSGHRGLGLASLWELLTGVLTASTTDCTDHITIRPHRADMLLLVVDPAISMSFQTFTARVDALIDRIHDSPAVLPTAAADPSASSDRGVNTI